MILDWIKCVSDLKHERLDILMGKL